MVNPGWWVSWYSHPDDGAFTMHNPWWISGQDMSDGSIIVVAAIEAVDEDAVWDHVETCYDNPPTRLRQRFCDLLGDRSPFSDRFPRADWMRWDLHAEAE